MPGKIAGLNSLFVDGQPVTTTGKVAYQAVSIKREAKMAGDGTLAGFKVTGEAPYIKFTAIDDGTNSHSALFALENIQIVARLANGRTVTGYLMSATDAPNTDADEAEFEMTFVGPSVLEI